jgi:hypothetical protein
VIVFHETVDRVVRINKGKTWNLARSGEQLCEEEKKQGRSNQLNNMSSGGQGERGKMDKRENQTPSVHPPTT